MLVSTTCFTAEALGWNWKKYRICILKNDPFSLKCFCDFTSLYILAGFNYFLSSQYYKKLFWKSMQPRSRVSCDPLLSAKQPDSLDYTSAPARLVIWICFWLWDECRDPPNLSFLSAKQPDMMAAKKPEAFSDLLLCSRVPLRLRKLRLKIYMRRRRMVLVQEWMIPKERRRKSGFRPPHHGTPNPQMGKQLYFLRDLFSWILS